MSEGGVGRRVVAERLQSDATSRGRAAAMSTGAAATVDAAAASDCLQVHLPAYCMWW